MAAMSHITNRVCQFEKNLIGVSKSFSTSHKQQNLSTHVKKSGSEKLNELFCRKFKVSVESVS
jgi:hypothetical protein